MAVLGSIGLHVLLLGLLVVVPSARPVSSSRLPVEIELRSSPVPSATPAPTEAPRHDAPPRASHGPSTRPSPARSLVPTPAPVEDSTVEMASATTKAPVDLFARSVIERGAAAGAQELGSARSDRESEAGATKRRVDGWLSDAKGRGDVTSGRVDPAFRVLEHRLHEELAIPKALLKPNGFKGGLYAQAKAFFGQERRSEPATRVDRAMDSAVSAPGLPASTYARPVEHTNDFDTPTWQELEIEVRLRADGSIEDVTVSRPSGNGKLDRHALAEVKRIAAARTFAVPHAATLVFAVRGGYAAKIPGITSSGYKMRFDLDGKPRADDVNPFESTKTEVVLRAVR